MISLICGDARHLALADASVDLIVTSPPYFALRSYTDGGQHYAGHAAHDRKRGTAGYDGSNEQQRHGFTTTQNPLGKLPGSVWEIASQPLTVPKELGVDHFAAFPMEWPRRIILGWSPSAICTACGQGRRPVTEPTGERGRNPGGQTREDKRTYANLSTAALVVRQIAGYSCACPEPTAPTRSAVVLDPFGGTGTTALVASVLGRQGISVDMSADYCRLAQWRTTDAKQLERAKRPTKPRPATSQPAPPEPEPPTAPVTAAEWLAHFGLNGDS